MDPPPRQARAVAARDGLAAALGSRRDMPTPIRVGDCQSPRTALEAIYEGHRAGRRV